jgi:hypothetical protein
MLFGSLFVFAVLVLAALLPNRNNAASLLSGYNQMAPEEQAAFPLQNYLQFHKRWLLCIAGMFLAIDLLLHFFAPPSWRIGSVLWLFTSLAMMLYQQGARFSPQQKTLYAALSGFLLLLGLGITWLNYRDYQNNEVVITAQKIEILGSYGTSMSLSDVSRWKLSNSPPALRNKRYGFADDQLKKGVFTATDGQKVRVFLKKGEAPYLYLESKTGEKIWFGLHSAQQKQIAKTLDSLQLPVVD